MKPRITSPRGIRLRMAVAALLLWQETSGAVAAPQAPSRIRILVIRGGGVINDVKIRNPQQLMVQVQDQNGIGVGGATVIFSVPRNGPGGVLSNGQLRMTVAADPVGIAVLSGFRPNATAGPFDIGVEAVFQNLRATETIRQTNVGPIDGGGGWKVAVLLLIVGSGAGAAFGLRKKDTGGPTPSTPIPAPQTTRLSLGSLRVGGS